MPKLENNAAFKEITKHISDIQTALAIAAPAHPLDAKTPKADKSLPVGRREILLVQKTTWFTSNYLINTADKTRYSSAYALVSGTPSPSSTVTQGYIHFVPQADLRPPKFSKLTIRMYIDLQFMQMTLQQLSHSNRYLWIGNFGNGHIYSDLHSSE